MQLHGRVGVNREAEPRAVFPQAVDIALGPMAEAEVEAFMHLYGIQGGRENFLGKLKRRRQREIAREWQNHGRIQAQLFQQAELVRQRRDQRRSLARAENALRVRVEGQHRGAGAQLLCPLDHLPQHVPVGDVQPVVVADRDHRGAEIARNLLEFVENLHL